MDGSCSHSLYSPNPKHIGNPTLNWGHSLIVTTEEHAPHALQRVILLVPGCLDGHVAVALMVKPDRGWLHCSCTPNGVGNAAAEVPAA